jgi:hypothetical protein
MHWVLIILTFDPSATITVPVNVAMQEFGDEASCVAAGAHTVDAIGQLEPKSSRGVKMLCEPQAGVPGIPPQATSPEAPR